MGSDQLISLLCVGAGVLIGAPGLMHAARLMLRAIAAARDPAVRATPMTPWEVFGRLYTEKVRPYCFAAGILMGACAVALLIVALIRSPTGGTGPLTGLCLEPLVASGVFLLGEHFLWHYAPFFNDAFHLTVRTILWVAVFVFLPVFSQAGPVFISVYLVFIVGTNSAIRRIATLPALRSDTAWFRLEDE